MSAKEINCRKVLKVEYRRQMKQVLMKYPLVAAEILMKSKFVTKKLEKIYQVTADVLDVLVESSVIDIDSINRAVLCFKAWRDRYEASETAEEKAAALEEYQECIKEKPG